MSPEVKQKLIQNPIQSMTLSKIRHLKILPVILLNLIVLVNGNFIKNCHGGFGKVEEIEFFLSEASCPQLTEEAHLGTFIPRVMTGAWTGVKGSSRSWSPSS